jgi:glycerol-3-phosphate dehydrogenase (NAD(P)+)
LGFGDNSKAALITRSALEMQALGAACGARRETFGGLSGLGDLTVTCFSKLSRNRTFGERLGRGESKEQIFSTTPSVVEGYPTTQSAWKLAQEKGLDLPILESVYAMLYRGLEVRQVVTDLLLRDTKSEVPES